jgi:hypothetical protein
VTGGTVTVAVVQERAADGWPVYQDPRHPTVRFCGQRGSQRAALYCALVGQAVAADQDSPVPKLVTDVVTELRDRETLQPTARRAQQRAAQEIRDARCHRHDGLVLNAARPSCPGCRAADREHPEGCQVCVTPHPFTQPCPDFY